MSGAANSPEYALNVGIDRKLAAHAASCWENGVHFVPLMVETLGGWSAEASETITRIGHLLQQQTGASLCIRHLFQQLAITLWRGNAALWIHQTPTLPPHVDGSI